MANRIRGKASIHYIAFIPNNPIQDFEGLGG